MLSRCLKEELAWIIDKGTELENKAKTIIIVCIAMWSSVT